MMELPMVQVMKDALEFICLGMPEVEPEDPGSDNHGDTRDYGYDVAHFHYGSIAKAALRGIRVFKDGNAWCATGLGFQDLVVGPAGFGGTVKEAVEAYAERLGEGESDASV